ncbi:MAG TPA: hypothetical protein DDW24_13550 [Blastocatellia bacterium]|nr:hypothetical protein [Blastocatellia bacterium]
MRASIQHPMQRNIANLLIAGALLLIVTACFCRSDRDQQSTDGDEPELKPVESSPVTNRELQPPQLRQDAGDFIVLQSKESVSRYRAIEQHVQSNKMLEKAAEDLNRALILPHDIKLRARDCDESNAFYDSESRTVTLCYELMERFYKTFRNAGANDEKAKERMFDATRFVFLHEIGHALIDAYKLPITGNEEDSADRLSSFVNLTELGDDGVRAVFAAADAFAIESKQRQPGKRQLADEHLLQEQRFYNSLCMIYGSDPVKHAKILDAGYLPKERAAKCKSEYQRTVQSWISLLEPWRKTVRR